MIDTGNRKFWATRKCDNFGSRFTWATSQQNSNNARTRLLTRTRRRYSGTANTGFSSKVFSRHSVGILGRGLYWGDW